MQSFVWCNFGVGDRSKCTHLTSIRSIDACFINLLILSTDFYTVMSWLRYLSWSKRRISLYSQYPSISHVSGCSYLTNLTNKHNHTTFHVDIYCEN